MNSNIYAGLTSNWHKVRGKLLEASLEIKAELNLQAPYTEAELTQWHDELQHQTDHCIAKQLLELNLTDSLSEVWELINISRDDFIRTLAEVSLQLDSQSEQANNGAVYNTLKGVFNRAQHRSLSQLGFTAKKLSNLNSWYRIYPLFKAAEENFDGRIDHLGDQFIEELIRQIGDRHVTKTPAGLRDIIIDYYYPSRFSGNPQNHSIDEEPALLCKPELTDPSTILKLIGSEQEMTRLSHCMNKLKLFNREMHEFITVRYLQPDIETDTSACKQLGVSNTKLNNRRDRGFSLLRKCLESESLSALQQLEIIE